MHVQQMLNRTQKPLLCVPLFMRLHPLPHLRKSFLLQVFRPLPLLRKMAPTARPRPHGCPRWRRLHGWRHGVYASAPFRLSSLRFGSLPPDTARALLPVPPGGGLGGAAPAGKLQLHQSPTYKGKGTPRAVMADLEELCETGEDCIRGSEGAHLGRMAPRDVVRPAALRRHGRRTCARPASAARPTLGRPSATPPPPGLQAKRRNGSREQRDGLGGPAQLTIAPAARRRTPPAAASAAAPAAAAPAAP